VFERSLKTHDGLRKISMFLFQGFLSSNVASIKRFPATKEVMWTVHRYQMASIVRQVWGGFG